MRYFVVGKPLPTYWQAHQGPAFQEHLQKVIVPTFHVLAQWREDGKLLAGGVPAASQQVLLVLELAATSHIEVRRTLFHLAIFDQFSWEVTPLESFEELLSVLQR